MLDGTGDTHGDVQFRRHDLASLADLHVVGHKAGINGSARRTDGRAQLVRHFFQHGEVLAVLHAATTRDDNLGTGQFGTLGLGQLFTDKGGNVL